MTALLALSCAGCGQKGPLYLPSESGNTSQPPAAPKQPPIKGATPQGQY
ncbi:MAG: hypothetical protein EPN21_15055 [Methylococcaceae bacterium]|nr:MAG: hypothetical protein EPN21_15055 [Methylococcaceae bacterium]